MDSSALLQLLKGYKAGKLSEEVILHFLKGYPYHSEKDLKLDFSRKARRGIPEAIYGEGKSLEQLKKIVELFAEKKEELIITRVSKSKWAGLKKIFASTLRYHPQAEVVTWNNDPKIKFSGKLLVVSAGTADKKVAEEAATCAEYLGNPVERDYDLGVACLARVLTKSIEFDNYLMIIVVAGMEGALPSVIAGLTKTPIVAIPSSQGYGANFSGLSALLSMLNSCSGGVAVVNIDNGFGAALLATLINQKVNPEIK